MAAGSNDRSGWLPKVGSVGLGVFFALLVAMLVTNWVVVDVRTFDHAHFKQALMHRAIARKQAYDCRIARFQLV